MWVSLDPDMNLVPSSFVISLGCAGVANHLPAFISKTLRVTPAMEFPGISDHVWSLE